MSKKTIAILLIVIATLGIGGIIGYQKYQVHQQQLAEQQAEQEFKEYWNNEVRPILNKHSVIENDFWTTMRNSGGKQFDNIFSDLNRIKSSNIDLKQQLIEVQANAKNDKQRLVSDDAKAYLDIFYNIVSDGITFFEQQKLFQANENYNGEKAEEARIARDAANDRIKTNSEKIPELSKKIREDAGLPETSEE